jgi:preprotein translocase SecE subunit
MLVGTELAGELANLSKGLEHSMRHLTWVILSFVVSAFLVILVMSAAVSSGLTRFGVPDFRFFGFLPPMSTMCAIVAGVVTFGFLIRNQKAMLFTDEVVGELARVTWPTRDETVRASVVVIFTTIFTASLLAAYDFLWKNVADYFLFSGGAGG